MSQRRVCTARSRAYGLLRGCVLLGATLSARLVKAQSSAPLVVVQSTDTNALPLLPGVMNKMTVVLDAAHGGADVGARISAPGGSTILEKNVTLALALKLQALLTTRGFTVVMVRTADDANKPTAAGATPQAMSMDDRAGLANSTRASACLLLHAAGSGHGVHLYSSELDGVSVEAPVLAWLTAQAAWVALSTQLERQIGAELQQAGVPRIIGRASVKPVDSLTCPAVAVELAPEGEDVNSVNDPDYQQRVASGIVGALEAWAKQVQPPQRMPSTLGHPKTTAPDGARHKPAGTEVQP